MRRQDRLACRGCNRKFLTEAARRRHYEWNSDHRPSPERDRPTGERGTDGLAAGETAADGGGTALAGSDWIAFDDRVETFFACESERGIGVRYDPDAGTVVVEDGDRRIRSIIPPDAASDRLRWTFDGRYLTMAFSTDR